jgi:hypothetical protein
MERTYHYKLWQRNDIENPLTLREIKSLNDKKIQIFDLKTGWHWLPDFEKMIKSTENK